jgi:type I restriction enzyme S subunit
MSLPRYENYKDSEVEWLGPVPKGWNVMRLMRVASVNDDVLPESTPPDFEIEYVDIGSVSLDQGIEKTERFQFSEAPSRARRLVCSGDVLVSTVRTYLKAIAPVINPPKNLVTSTGFAVVRPSSRLNSAYAKYALQATGFVDEVISRSTGVSYPAINASDLMRISIPVPPIDEQTTIANFLSGEASKIDTLVTEQERLITLLVEKRQTTISHAVTRGLNPNTSMKNSGVSWLGEVPAHWTLPPLYMRYSSELGKMLDASRITGSQLVPYLRNVDVQWDAINYSNLPLMDIAPVEYARYTVCDGDLLVCEGGEVGRAAVVQHAEELTGYQKALHRLRALSDEEHTRYMFYTFAWASKAGAFGGEGQSTIAHLTGEQLRKYRFPKPPAHEQKAIADFLDAEVARLMALTHKAENAIGLLKERRSALIAAAVTGKIDVRGLVTSSAEPTKTIPA